MEDRVAERADFKTSRNLELLALVEMYGFRGLPSSKLRRFELLAAVPTFSNSKVGKDSSNNDDAPKRG